MSNKDLNYKEGEYSEQELEILFPGIKKKENRGLWEMKAHTGTVPLCSGNGHIFIDIKK